MNGLSAEDISIAVTVYNRRQFVKQAVRSALAQTIPVRVLVLEDCSPDLGLADFVREEFGSRVDYFRNPHRRGLFDNWNACIEKCGTRWLSILHDDDFLPENFVESVLELSRHVPDCGLYYGQTGLVNETGDLLSDGIGNRIENHWRRADLAETVNGPPFAFPGHIFRVEYARALGGFRAFSQYTGDWEMWSKLTAFYGAAQTHVVTGYQRSHRGPERGSSKVYLNGRLWALVFIQQKRVIHLLRRGGRSARFDRQAVLSKAPMSVSFLLSHGARLSPRMLRYCVALVALSTPPSFPYWAFRIGVRLFGARFVRLLCAFRSGSFFAKVREPGLSNLQPSLDTKR